MHSQLEMISFLDKANVKLITCHQDDDKSLGMGRNFSL